MKKVNSLIVKTDFVIGQAKFPDYKSALAEVRKLSEREKIALSGQQDFQETWNELFNDDTTQWFETDLPPTTDFVNKIFDSGKGFMRSIGLKHSDLLKEYKSGKINKKFKKQIDTIRKTLSPKPRIIVLTKDFKEYSIFDGGRRALAFILEKKNVPCYVGQRKKFSALKYIN